LPIIVNYAPKDSYWWAMAVVDVATDVSGVASQGRDVAAVTR